MWKTLEKFEMIKTYILGSGFLSNNLGKKVKNSKIYSAIDFVKNLKKIDDNKKFNLIINTFYSSRKLNKIQSYENFVKKSLSEVSVVIDKIGKKKINKIIYTSSSSVYGSINNNILVSLCFPYTIS